MSKKIKNQYLNDIYIQCINKEKNTKLFEEEITKFINNPQYLKNEYDFVDIITLINKIKKPNNLSNNFIYNIFKESVQFKLFLRAKNEKENFLIKSILNCYILKEDQINFLELLIKNYKLYIYNNFEYIKKTLTKYNILNIWEPELKKIYYDNFLKDNNIRSLVLSDFIKNEEIEKISKEEKITENILIQNFKLMDNIITKVINFDYKFDLKYVLKEKMNLNLTEIEIQEIEKDGVNIYADTVLNQKMTFESYNNYSKLFIELVSMASIKKSIFIGYKKIQPDAKKIKELKYYIKDKLEKKYKLNKLSNRNLSDIVSSILSFIYGVDHGIFNFITILEKIIRTNYNNDEILNILSKDCFLDNFIYLKNIYIRQSNIDDTVSLNEKLKCYYDNNTDYFSLDIRNKFCHGLFLNKRDEENSAMYTYIFILKFLELDEFYKNYI